MTAEPIEADGHLPAALRALTAAIHALIEPRATLHDGNVVNAPSLYLQLWDAVGGSSTNGGGAGSSGKSRPPVWIDALVLLDEIDTAVACWQPAFTGVPPTVGRLRHIERGKHRPQDVRKLGQITEAVQSWSSSIEELMNPTPKWSLPYACPRCGTKHVYRRDTSGDMVRSYALQISPEGCTCSKCRATWAPGQFLFLGQLLDTVPENVERSAQ